ncbi:hypothetical protein ACJ73_08336 [Blastomyces percursus]|uniref:CCHC-type domain-containing protein n=1 Tax=Blastomyces percursus TaxID=1658174 RepID=A0A1J9PVD4_9EURO|nr:hypothetical protein ACJ73_08336 [Blastomyces percursus]
MEKPPTPPIIGGGNMSKPPIPPKPTTVVPPVTPEHDHILESMKEKMRMRFNQQAKEIENLESAISLLKTQVFQEDNDQVRNLLIPISQQLDEILKLKVDESENLKLVPPFQTSYQPSRYMASQATVEKPYSYAQAVKGDDDIPSRPQPQPVQLAKTLSFEERKKKKDSQLQQSKKHRLILKPSDKKALSLLSNPKFVYSLRNELNQCFLSDDIMSESDNKSPVVATIGTSFMGTSIVVTTTSGFTADFLIRNEEKWRQMVEGKLQTEVLLEKDEKWGKFVLHNVPMDIFDGDEGLIMLQHEIEDYNPPIQLREPPKWLNSYDARRERGVGSVVVTTSSPEQAKVSKIRIAAMQLNVFEYKDMRPAIKKSQIQCKKCQRWGHFPAACRRPISCAICAQNHETREHSCTVCSKIGVACPHSLLKCSNCKEKHIANAKECPFYPKSSGQAEDVFSSNTVEELSTETQEKNLKRRASKVDRTPGSSPSKSKPRKRMVPMKAVEIIIPNCE